MAENFAIQMQGITKTFGSTVANKNVNLTVKQGEILALLGENGSGKTTLMNMLSGIYQPDSGDIFVDGNRVDIRSPEDAKQLGIGMVHQHFKLVDVFSAADNIWMGKEKSGLRLKKDRYSEIEDMAKKFGFDIFEYPKRCGKLPQALEKLAADIRMTQSNFPDGSYSKDKVNNYIWKNGLLIDTDIYHRWHLTTIGAKKPRKPPVDFDLQKFRQVYKF